MKTYPLVSQNQHGHHPFNRTKSRIKPSLPPKQQQQQQQQQTEEQQCPPKETDVTLVMGRAPWWIPSPVAATMAGSQTRNFTFAEALKVFLQNFSFHSYGKLVEPGRPCQEKLFWLAFHILAMSALIIFLTNYHNTDQRLLTTSIYNPIYPISEVSFPAVSICSMNRISNESAKLYARELQRKDPRKRSAEYFYGQIKYLQYNYYEPGEMPDYEKALKFQRFLDIYDRKDDELFFNTRRRMAMLTPNCSSILKVCRLGGEDADCLREFTETFTARGLCCTFNRNRKYSAKRKFRHRFLGPDMGLVVLLNASQKDDFIPSVTSERFEVFIHSSHTAPDPSSGSVEVRIVEGGKNTFLALKPRIFQTIDEVRYYKPKVRNCMFNDELPDVFGKSYTYSNCISYCRTRSQVVLCECLPFMANSLNISSSTAFCTLQHRGCLMRYDFKWYNVMTQRPNTVGLDREMEDSLYCPYCLPTCSETQYTVTVMDLPLNKFNMKSFPRHKENYSDLAVLHVYFGVTNGVFYRRFLLNSWFEKFSYIGSICGVIAGFSLIGIGEVIFFVVQQLIMALRSDAYTEERKNRRRKATNPLLILP
ncbi:sodium channel protein Nach [Musca domestica]|uniref:Sodium channel protein Nach n=1 Tax=Musca domestica TaxID=7370 RepID=A0ABM3VFQ2_MUSDO|nr:sodium channel protein Nach [Musca domestica]